MRWWWKSRERNADLLAFEGEFVTFQVDEPLELLAPVTLEAHVPEQQGLFEITLVPTHEVEADAALMGLIEGLHYAPRRHIYCARLKHPPESEQPLRILLSALPSACSHHHRLQERLPRKLRAFSSSLPEGRGFTLDLSLTGLSLRTNGPVPPGLLLPLSLVFDEVQYPALQIEARVRWCRECPPNGSRPGGYVLGAHFENLTPPQQRELRDFLHAALHAEPISARGPVP